MKFTKTKKVGENKNCVLKKNLQQVSCKFINPNICGTNSSDAYSLYYTNLI